MNTGLEQIRQTMADTWPRVRVLEGRKVLVPLLKYPSTIPAAFRAWT